MSKFILSILLFLLFFTISLTAQKEDNVWLFGYSSNINIDSTFGGSRLEFNDIQSPELFYEYRSMDLDFLGVTISNNEGELICYSNGIYVANDTHEEIENSYGINEDFWWPLDEEDGYRLTQGAILLPHPTDTDKKYLIHCPKALPPDYFDYYSPYLYSTLIDFSESEEGIVLEKNTIIKADTFAFGGITATQHANGRDWWIVLPDKDTDLYNLFLLDENGVNFHHEEQIGINVEDGVGQNSFSPDGSIYVRYEGEYVDQDQHIIIQNFDRCSGTFSNQTYFTIPYYGSASGLVISPSNRYLYLSNKQFLYQFDLLAEDIESSMIEVGEYDGYYNGNPVFQTKFFLLQNAPDGKIYMSTTNTTQSLHVIHEPNKPGIACDFRQNLFLPTRNRGTLPNFPNFRLGPLDNSSCDTLGIDNLPLANFRYSPDTLNQYHFSFTDVSYYEPTSWLWTFGDGNSSTEIDPEHTYEADGTYEVCVTVSNENGSDTFCREIQIITSGVSDYLAVSEVETYPNPATKVVQLRFEFPLPEGLNWELLDVSGRVVSSQYIAAGSMQAVMELDCTSGVYLQQLRVNGGVFWSEKLVVLR